jgi:hypothetical protein
MTSDGKATRILNPIIQRLDRGDVEGAAKCLFDPQNQAACTKKTLFWYAQILVATLQNKGFHIAFLTAYKEKDLKPYSRSQTDRIVDIEEMIIFFRHYLNNPALAAYHQKIEDLIAFYENDVYKDPFRDIVVPTATPNPS